MMEGQTTPAAGVPKGKRVLSVLKRFKWVILAVAVVVAALVAYQAYQAGIERRWDKAKDYFAKADYPKAAKEMEGLSMPKDADRLKVYSQTMLATQKLDKAAKGYEKLYEINKDPFDKVVLGNIYNQQKRYDEAAKVYREVIKSNPAYVQAYVNLATMYRLQQNNKAAIDAAKDGVTNNPNNVVLAELLVSLTMDNKNSPEYQDALSKLEQLNPKSPLLEALKQ